MFSQNSIAAIYKSHTKAEETVKTFQDLGFDMKNLSIIEKDMHTDEHLVGGYNTGKQILWRVLIGGNVFSISGIGSVMIGGSLLASIVEGLEREANTDGMSSLGAGLVILGVPENSVLDCEKAVRAGLVLLIVHGAEKMVKKAKEIIQKAGTSDIVMHKRAPLHEMASDLTL